jgi:hypothetical protein
MSRIVRSPEPLQPVLPLGHGAIQWDTLPQGVRERVLALWMQMLMEYLAYVAADAPPVLPIGPSNASTTESPT